VNVDNSQAHPQESLDRAIRGNLEAGERAALERHIVGCPLCEVELEVAELFRSSVTPDRDDEALHRSAIDGAMKRLQRNKSAGLAGRLRRWLGAIRPSHRAAGVSVLGLAMAVGVVLLLFRSHRSAQPPSSSELVLRPVILEDGSVVTPTTATTAVQVEEQSPTRTTVRLTAGSARFLVRHDSIRRFCVEAGEVEIEDLGTDFRVTHEAAGKVRVAVSEGKVAVRYRASADRVELQAGENRTFDTMPASGSVTESSKEVPKTAAPSSPAAVSQAGAAHARPSEDPASLLLAADLARRSHNPQGAVASLRRIVERYPKDPRAASAAFTLGWVLLTDLGRPREAAAAFEEAERRASRGMLAEDAAARVAEAWQRAGDSRRAAQAARHYEMLYPTGRHLPLMHALTGGP
jgi:TolA-binding protein